MNIKISENCKNCPYMYNEEYCTYHDIYIEDLAQDICSFGYKEDDNEVKERV